MILAGNDYGTKLLINEFDIDLDEEHSIVLDGVVVIGATVLWVAASVGNLTIVKMLVERGVNVNHTTGSDSTPLRVACQNNRIDIIRYFLKHGACVESRNKNNNTCLMVGAGRGLFQVVNYYLHISLYV